MLSPLPGIIFSYLLSRLHYISAEILPYPRDPSVQRILTGLYQCFLLLFLNSSLTVGECIGENHFNFFGLQFPYSFKPQVLEMAKNFLCDLPLLHLTPLSPSLLKFQLHQPYSF